MRFRRTQASCETSIEQRSHFWLSRMKSVSSVCQFLKAVFYSWLLFQESSRRNTHTKMFLHAPFHRCGEKIKNSREESLRRQILGMCLCSQEAKRHIHQDSTTPPGSLKTIIWSRWTVERCVERTPGIVLFPTIASLKGQSGRCQWFRLNDSNLLHFELSKERSTKRSSRSKSQIKVNSHSVT